MNTQAAVAEAYPENWEDHAKATAEGERNIKLKDGQSVQCHIVSGPLTYREMYVSLGVDEKGKETKKRIALPFGANLPGYKLKVKYIVEVIITDGPNKGAHKLLEFGKQIADQLEGVKLSSWKSTRVPDLLIKRKGSGMNDTEYFVTAIPGSLPAEGNPVEFNLVSEVRYATAEDIKLLPKPTAVPDGGTKAGITDNQVDFLGGLCKAKELTAKALSLIIERKFGKDSLAALSSTEASTLIETLQGM